jgi:hypothetical protein
MKFKIWCLNSNIAAKYDKIIWDQQVSCEIRDSHGVDYKNIVFCKVLRFSEMSVNQKISHLLFLHDPTNLVIIFWIFHYFSYSKNLFTHIHIQSVSQKHSTTLWPSSTEKISMQTYVLRHINFKHASFQRSTKRVHWSHLHCTVPSKKTLPAHVYEDVVV